MAFEQSELERLGQLYELLVRTGCSPESQGAIGFLLCCRSADRAQSMKAGRSLLATDDTSRRIKAAFADASKFLINPAVRGWIASYYGIDRFKVVNPDAEAAMIASGTTSYVIRYDVSENFVLKLVKPQFMSSPHIREQTSSYGELLRAQAGHNSFLPRVQATGSSYIQMEFIDGHSLADLLELGILDAMTTDERRELLFGIIGNLEALRTPHLDLSPGNIMVVILPMGRDKIRRFKVRLIDFGYNFLLREGLSGLPIRNDVVRYSAPEMMAGSYEGSTKADLYSPGMIILDVMRSSPNAVDLSVQLDRCWQAHPQLASIVEELIATDPVDRAPWANGLDQPAAYQALRQRLEQEERTTKLIEVRLSATSAWSGFEDLIQEFFKIVREVPALWWSTDNDKYSVNTRYLYWWSLGIKSCLIVAGATCGFYLLQAIGRNLRRRTDDTGRSFVAGEV